MHANHPSRCEQIELRGLRYNVRHWGPHDAPPVFFLHGWMDASATFQFIAEALAQDWHVIAPDWRGYGASEWLGRAYSHVDYYTDLEALLGYYAFERPARIVGHSMGAGIAAIYAGVRPQHVAQLVMLDFLGLLANRPEDAPGRLATWLEAHRTLPRLRVYPDHAALARRLMSVNKRLTADRAEFLAHHVGLVRPEGGVSLACDPWHKIASPLPYRVEEAMACWRQIKAPVLMLVADDGYVEERFGDAPDEYRRRLDCFANAQVVTIADSGHNIQHDQPEQAARAIEAFLLRA